MFEIKKSTPPEKIYGDMHNLILDNRDILNHILLYYKEHGTYPKTSKVKGVFGRQRNESYQQLVNLGMINEESLRMDRLAALTFGGFLYCDDPQANAYKKAMYDTFETMAKWYDARHEAFEVGFDEFSQDLYPRTWKESQTFLVSVLKLFSKNPYAIFNLTIYPADGHEAIRTIAVSDRIFDFNDADDFFQKCYETIQPSMEYKATWFGSKPIGRLPSSSDAEQEYKISKEKFGEGVEFDSTAKFKCFVIMPIGKKDTVEYANNMRVFDEIIKPCVENSGYSIHCYHSDLIGIPGSIPAQIIKALHDDDIVIADLRRQNPNVIWELGVRHTFLKRSIMVCSDLNQTFFDTSTYRVAQYFIDGKSNHDFFIKLKGFIADIMSNPSKPDNPVMHHPPATMQIISGSKEPLEFSQEKEAYTFGYMDGSGGLQNVNGVIKFLVNNAGHKNNSIIGVSVFCESLADKIEIDASITTTLPLNIPAESLEAFNLKFNMPGCKINDSQKAKGIGVFDVTFLFVDKFKIKHEIVVPFHFK